MDIWASGTGRVGAGAHVILPVNILASLFKVFVLYVVFIFLLPCYWTGPRIVYIATDCVELSQDRFLLHVRK